MDRETRQLIESGFWNWQMLDFIHPRYIRSKYERRQGQCARLRGDEVKLCLERHKLEIDNLMLYAQYFKMKNTKCVEEGVLSGYDLGFVEKTCWSKMKRVMDRQKPIPIEYPQTDSR